MAVRVDTKVYFAYKPVTVIFMEKIVARPVEFVWSQSNVKTPMERV